MVAKRLFGLGAVLAATLTACATYLPDQSGKSYIAYKPSTVDGTVEQTNFRIAILPFEDNSSVLELKSEAARQENNYYKFSNLVPWALAEELKHNKAGAVVHVAPSLTDDYDLVVKGVWAARETVESAVGTTMKAGFAVYSPNDPKPLFEKTYQRFHEKKLWVNITLTEKVTFVRQSVQNFILDAQPVVNALTDQLTDKSRRFAYYQTLDPELTTITSSIAKSQRSGNRRAAAQLMNGYKSRLGYLEAYRAKEWEVLVSQNSYKENTYRERLQEIARYVKEKRRLQAEIAKQQAEIDASRRKQQNAALASILLAAQGASKAGVSDVDVLSTALTDMGTALQNLPPPPVLDIDDALLRQEVDLKGLQDFSVDSFGRLEGSSLSDVRKKFLALYKRKTKDLRAYYY